jgi:hypothetical protein
MWAKAWAQAPLMASWPRGFRADADAGHHVADLADDVVGEQAAAVVLEHGVHHAVERHDHAERDEDLHAGKPRQRA